MNGVDAFVSDDGAGDRVTVMVTAITPPEMRRVQFVNISADDARVLADKLTRAANLAEQNTSDDLDELL